MQTPSRFFDADWAVQSYIVQNLTVETENQSNSDFRRGYTAFQLCICYLNGFGTSPDKVRASEFLDYAVSLGCTQAQHLFYRLKVYLLGHCDPNPTVVQWLVEGMSSTGYTRHVAARDLAAIDKAKYDVIESRLYLDSRVRNCVIGDVHLDFDDIQMLQQAVKTLPKPLSLVFIGLNRNTLLHQAVLSRSVSALSLLLQEGDVDINMCNSFGETPLLLASQAGCLPMVELLINSGARYVPNNKEKMSPLHFLLRFPQEYTRTSAMVLSRADYPIDMNIAESGTPLYWAVARRAARRAPTGIARNSLEAVKM